ncbi:hypothetical protein ACWEVP_50255 [Amycolatopsis sp. NPDC003865]
MANHAPDADIRQPPSGNVGPQWARADIAIDALRLPRRYVRRHLRDLGVPCEQLRQLRFAAYRHSAGRALAAVALYITAMQLTGLVVGPPTRALQVFQLFAISGGIAAAATAMLSDHLRPRARLLTAALRTAELALLLNPSAPDRLPDGAASFRRRVRRDPEFRRRLVAKTAWILTRDTARVNSAPARPGGLGHVLLWYSANPRDPRRGPILTACLLEFFAAATDADQPIPHPDFTPAARYPTLSPRSRLLQNLRDIGSGALVTGVVVAVVTALLKLWVG